MAVWSRRPSPKGLEKSLERKRAELMRRKEELEVKLETLPSVIEAKRKEEVERIGRRARVAGRPISAGGTGVRRPVRQRTPGHRARIARLKALALLFIFALIILLVLRAVPTQ